MGSYDNLEEWMAKSMGPSVGAPSSTYRDTVRTELTAFMASAESAPISVLTYGAVGDGTTDDTESIQAAIDAAEAAGGGTVTVPQGTYLISAVLVMDTMSNVHIQGSGTIKMEDGYTGYYVDGYYGLWMEDCTNCSFSGVALDGNKANVTQENVFVKINAGDVAFHGCTLKNSNYHALYLLGDLNVVVGNCTFKDNCTATGNDSDVYGGGADTQMVFYGNNFTRTREQTAQAFYIANGSGTFINNRFEGPNVAYDFRDGSHTIQGGSGNVGMFLITQVGTPTVRMFDVIAGINTDDAIGVFVEGIYASSGSIHVENCVLTGSEDAQRAVRIASSSPCTVKNNKFSGFSAIGVYIRYSAGGHVVEGNTLTGPGGAGRGIYSLDNSGSSYYKNNTLASWIIDYDNTDGYLVPTNGGPVTVKKVVDASGGGTAQETTIATIPAGAIVTEVVAKVKTAFDGDAGKTLEVGVSGNPDKYIDTVELDCTDNTDWQAMTGGGSNDQGSSEYLAAETDIIATWTNDASASAGAVEVWVTYM